jgi:hypothetical protein
MSGCPDCDRYRMLCAEHVKKKLEERICQLVEEFFPDGHYEPGRREYRMGSVAGEAGTALSIVIGGPKNGQWFDHQRQEGWDLVGLLAKSHCHGDRKAALELGRQWLGQPERQRPAPPLPAHRPDADVENFRRAEVMYFDQAARQRRDDLIDRYFGGRAVDLENIARAHGGTLPLPLRLHPRLMHLPSGTAWPAMVAAISGPDGKFCSVQRTYLREHEDGCVTKAFGKKSEFESKMALGRFKGGCIRLWGPRWDEATSEDYLAISEGIEDAMTLVEHYPSWRFAASAGLGTMLSMSVPNVISRIVLIGQNDRPSFDKNGQRQRGAVEVFEDVRDRFRRESREVRLWRWPAHAKDANELAMQRWPGDRCPLHGTAIIARHAAMIKPFPRDVDQKTAGAAIEAPFRLR